MPKTKADDVPDKMSSLGSELCERNYKTYRHKIVQLFNNLKPRRGGLLIESLIARFTACERRLKWEVAEQALQ